MSADDEDRCGIDPISTGSKDPFYSPCRWHDKMYILNEKGKQPLSRKEVDQRFLNAMKIVAGDSKMLKARAYLYYYLARTFGGIFW